MKKGTGFLTLLIVIAIMVGFGYIMMYGVDERGSGATRNTKLGLDLAGGVSITYEVVGEETPSAEDVEDTIMKLRKRIDKYSTESAIYQEGDNRISIEIPGVTDAEAVLAELGSPGALYFIKATGSDGTYNYQLMTTLTGMQVYSETENLFVYAQDGNTYAYDEATHDIAFDASGNPVTYTVTDQSLVNTQYELTKPIDDIVADGSVILTGTDVASSEGKSYTDNYNTVQYIVSLSFTDEGAQKFADATAAAAVRSGLDKTIAIFYDGRLISVPSVNEAITGGQAQITGMNSAEEAKNLAQDIRIGGLKLELSELRSNVVGAQLGGEAINTSINAGIIGIALVMVLMIILYRIPGLASAIALGIYTQLTLLCINFLEITLTLPGIAGIILSIGMAVDANVIIFARIKEEIAAGLSVETAIKSGFNKALSAILDGNITTLIAALVLMAMGSGSIKGFAYTLALGIILSMITALFVTRTILNAFYAIGFRDAKFFGKAKERKPINFLGKKKTFFGISIAIIFIGFVAMGIFGGTTGKPLNFSLEFMGGTATTVDFEQALERTVVDTEVVPKIETIIGDANVQWTDVNNSNQIIFKTKTLSSEERDAIRDMLVADYGVVDTKITVESISSTISGEMQKEALVAILIASLCMLVYIWFRFSDFRFGTSAVAALIHDVLVVLTFYACARLSVGSTFIACMLTIVGYSINATIVIFDRIRENLRQMKKKDTLEDVVNKSITQTISRSIFTSLTTFITIFVLFILGVSSIREFALPLMIGIISGTYSSICVTGALWWCLRNKFPQVEEDD